MIIAGATTPTANESEEQRSLFVWATIAAGKYPALNLLFHIPNEGKRSPWTGARMRSEGLKSGVPDLCLPVARSGYHGLYIELKAGKKSRPPISWRGLKRWKRRDKRQLFAMVGKPRKM